VVNSQLNSSVAHQCRVQWLVQILECALWLWSHLCTIKQLGFSLLQR